MALPNGHSPAFPNPLYQEVKAWVAEQEAFEVTNQVPAPLTDVQRMFLEDFCARPPLPDIGQVDYVSLLNRYRDANPTGADISYTEGVHEIRTAEGNLQWTFTVKLSETLTHEPAIDSFPAAGFGLDASGCLPPFTKKKDAKKYAARCAVDWLIKKSLMPSNLRDVAFPKNYLSAVRALPEPQSQPEKRPNEGTNGVLSPPPKRQTKETTGTVYVDDDSLPATQRVQELCHSMGLTAPRYELTHADPRVNFIFDGHPDFGNDGDSFPEDLGRVTGVAGRDNAKQEIAQRLLAHLRGMYEERMAAYELVSAPSAS